MNKYPEDPIFRTERGASWSKSSLAMRFYTMKRAANKAAKERGISGIQKEVTSYSFRHAYVTRWIEQGRPLWKLCELLNTSEAMLRQHCSHLFEQTDSRRESLNDFDRGRGMVTKSSVKPTASSS